MLLCWIRSPNQSWAEQLCWQGRRDGMQKPDYRIERQQMEDGRAEKPSKTTYLEAKDSISGFLCSCFMRKKMVNHMSCILPITQQCLECSQYRCRALPYLRDPAEEEEEPACLEFYTRRNFGKTQLETCAPLSHTWALPSSFREDFATMHMEREIGQALRASGNFSKLPKSV